MSVEQTKEPLVETDAGKRPRRAYRKPAFQTIPLVTKEVLAAGCKFVGGTGEFGDCHLGASCSAEGS